jgi:NitT/TauT family transport system permease protein
VNRSKAKRSAFSIGGLLAALGLWQAAIFTGFGHPLYLPAPLDTARVGIVLAGDHLYWSDLLVTLRRAGAGFLLAGIFGIPIGLILGIWDSAYYAGSATIDFLRSIPTAALLPLFLVFFGLGDSSKIAVIFFGCFFIFLIGALYGARGGPETILRRRAVRVMGATKFQEFVLIVVPESLLGVAASLRLAASLALVLAVFTEMFLGAEDGVGRRLIDSYLSFDIPAMYAYIVTLGIVGVLVNRLLELTEESYISLRR